PLVAFWPKGITAKKGSTSGQVGHVMDFMATFTELANAKYPSEYHGNKILPMQGISLAPAFKGKQSKGHQVLFNEHFGARYVRTEEWKMVGRNKEKWHLYRIQDDETELKDLSEQYPQKVQELDSLWNNWANSNNVMPKKSK
ncbi:MAG TPA: sulfatase/phosphatase domain-containing protein, partial [Flavitalea sp.]|nr:sulfatase/phosphatase domain-containing protein [Flavitalea sp.]